MLSRSRNKRMIIAVGVLIGIVALWLIWPTDEHAQTTVSPTSHAPKVETIQVVKDSIRPEIDLLGRVKAQDNALLTSQIQGKVLAVHVKPGQTVSQGELLAEIESSDYQTTYVREQARLDELQQAVKRIRAGLKTAQTNLQYVYEDTQLAKKDYQRLFKLRQQGFGDQKNLDIAKQSLLRSQTDYEARQLNVEELTLQVKEAEAAITQQSATLKQAELNLARTQINAPFNGVVTEKRVSRGDFVTTGTAMIRLINPYDLLITASLSFQEANKIGPEAVRSAYVELPEYQNADISLVGVTGLQDAAAEIHFSLNQKNLYFNNGQGIKVRLKLPEVSNSYWIPESALFSRRYVYSLNVDKKLVAHQVELLGQATQKGENGYLIKTSADLSSYRILNTPLPRVVEGMLVEPVNT